MVDINILALFGIEIIELEIYEQTDSGDGWVAFPSFSRYSVKQQSVSNGQPSCFTTNISYNLSGCGRINPLGVHRRAGKDPAFIFDETKKSPQNLLRRKR